MGVCDNITGQKKMPRAKSYFVMPEDQTNQNSNNKVKLEFGVDGCKSNSKYQVECEFLNTNIPPFFTETVKSHQNIVIFNTCYICDFFFERQQMMRISIIRNGNNIGSITPFLSTIISSPNSTFRTNLFQGAKEIISISAQGICDTNSFIFFNFFAVAFSKKNLFNKPEYKISYNITSNGRKVYVSESISTSGNFKVAKIPVALLEPQFTVAFTDHNQNPLIFKNETINTFVTQISNNSLYQELNLNNKIIRIFNQSRLLRQYSFIDYIKNGVTLKLSIGIDFTASNGEPDNPNSLHCFSNGYMNDYEAAIRACGIIMAYYDYNQLFPTYGFGAVIANGQKPNMCFNINFKQNPEIYTIDNVIQEYHNCLQRIQFAGPTEFCPMIQNVINIIRRENNPLKYHVLMILTDGIIVDLEKTIDALVEGSFLPLSVIIIGIGNDHFQEMFILDGDNVPLISSSGIQRMRDLVQFVPFNKYRNNPNELAAQVLEEIQNQIVEYYTFNNIYPNNLSMAQIRTKRTIDERFNINNYGQMQY